MSAVRPVTYSVDGDGVGWVVFDDPTARANVLNDATRAALAEVWTDMERNVGRETLKAVVIATGKERIFIAGADVKQLAALPDAGAAEAFAKAGQALFGRIEKLGVPVVAAIHGACAGGGLELALVCAWRVASSDAATRIGLPETSLGTIPGWGGSVRLPRLIGAKAALEHILAGQLLPAAKAREVGLVQDVVTADELRTRAKTVALALANGSVARPRRPEMSPPDFEAARGGVRRRERARNPAWAAAIEVVEETAGLPLAEALAVEARVFGRVTAGEGCRNLIRVFLLREGAKKRTLAGWFDHTPDAAPPRVVGVVGAGVMGSGIAQALAARGFDVVLRDVSDDVVERGMGVVRGLFESAVKRGTMSAGDAAAAIARIATTTSWQGFERVDLVIEAIVENVGAKQTLMAELEKVVGRDVVLASNTSALPIEEIGCGLGHPGRLIGIHFFNPVSRMPLVELVLGPATTGETAARALALVRALGKAPVICRSSPGFLVTRVLFFYLNEAVRVWESGVSTEELDAAMREFGWPMGPLRLIDEVGVDVTDFIFAEMADYFPERFVATRACGRLLQEGRRGRKNGAGSGFYRYEGERESPIELEESRDVTPARTRPEEIRERLMRVMVEEARRCVAEGVVKTEDEVDFALLSGAGFPAFRGGLLHWAGSGRLLRKD